MLIKTRPYRSNTNDPRGTHSDEVAHSRGWKYPKSVLRDVFAPPLLSVSVFDPCALSWDYARRHWRDTVSVPTILFHSLPIHCLVVETVFGHNFVGGLLGKPGERHSLRTVLIY